MKTKLIAALRRLIDRLAGEPVMVRGGIAAVVNLLVVSGVIDTGASTEATATALGLVNLILLASARQRVTPIK